MTASSPWNLRLRVVSPDVPDPVFTELPLSRELWERIREQALSAGMPTEQWISQQLRGELQSIIATARTSALHPLEASAEVTNPDSPLQ